MGLSAQVHHHSVSAWSQSNTCPCQSSSPPPCVKVQKRGAVQYPAILRAHVNSGHFQNSECRARVGRPVLLQRDDAPVGIHGECIAIFAAFARIVECSGVCHSGAPAQTASAAANKYLVGLISAVLCDDAPAADGNTGAA
jgi:hypothetical protein